MKPFGWNKRKNEDLKKIRNISFEEVVDVLLETGPISVTDHPNQIKYPGQKIFSLEIKDYICLVPFVETENEIFLKTIFPSRKARKELGKKGEKHGKIDR